MHVKPILTKFLSTMKATYSYSDYLLLLVNLLLGNADINLIGKFLIECNINYYYESGFSPKQLAAMVIDGYPYVKLSANNNIHVKA
jgi:hypothetical protein